MQFESETVGGKKQERECKSYAHKTKDEKVKWDCTEGCICDVCRTLHSFPSSHYTVASWIGLLT